MSINFKKTKCQKVRMGTHFPKKGLPPLEIKGNPGNGFGRKATGGKATRKDQAGKQKVGQTKKNTKKGEKRGGTGAKITETGTVGHGNAGARTKGRWDTAIEKLKNANLRRTTQKSKKTGTGTSKGEKSSVFKKDQ